MRKLELFRIIGESFAHAHAVRVDKFRAELFFQITADSMYPSNLHRRDWAYENMMMFFTQEHERMAIMRKLSDTGDVADDIIAEIRKRNASQS